MSSDDEYLLSPAPRRLKPEEIEEELARTVGEAEAAGELRHLQGKPLDLSDDSPDWFLRKALKQAGFSHPTIERMRELEEPIERARSMVDRLRVRHERLAARGSSLTAAEVEAFNVSRSYELEAYAGKLVELNRLIRDANLAVPAAMQRRPFDVQREVERVGREIPALEVGESPAPRRSGWWRRRRRS
jgi:hypothetical protein